MPAHVRRGYLDWLRGLAVLIMIEAHVLDSWTRPDARESTAFGLSMILGGMGAPLFLFLAGVSVALSAGSKAQRSGDDRAASSAVVRRGLQIFGLAFLFRLQAVIVSWGSWISLLKVDILNIMGPSIAAAAAVWGALRGTMTRVLAFAGIALALAFLTPPVRGFEFLSALPDPIEGYLRPRPGFTNFAVFPWSGFVFAGGAVGVLLHAKRTAGDERRTVTWIAAAGAVLAALSYAASFLPSPFANSQFWTSAPSFFLLRAGLLALAIGAAYAWERRSRATDAAPAPGDASPARLRWSPLRQIGRTSLFIYWIHIELIYGLVVRPLHKSLTLGQAWIGVVIFSILMVLASLLKERIVTRLARPRAERSRSATTFML